MFYNDPMLYGATLPYKDANFQTPFVPQHAHFTPWQNLPRYLPQNFYGYQDFTKFPFAQIPQLPFLGWQGFPFQQLPFQQIPFQQVPFQQVPFQQIPFQQLPFQQLPFQNYMQGYTPFSQFGYGMNVPFYGYKTPYSV